MEKRLTYEDFEKIGTISRLPEIEKEDYIKRHENFWKEDLEVAEKLVEISPRWALVAGYYAMHDFAKLFLAKKFNIKISGAFVHIATIEALKKFVEEEVVNKMNRAFEEVSVLPEFLEFARRERSKSQYYSKGYRNIDKNFVKTFLQQIVKPFIKKLKEMM
jgi:hypothetical protein